MRFTTHPFFLQAALGGAAQRSAAVRGVAAAVAAAPPRWLAPPPQHIILLPPASVDVIRTTVSACAAATVAAATPLLCGSAAAAPAGAAAPKPAAASTRSMRRFTRARRAYAGLRGSFSARSGRRPWVLLNATSNARSVRCRDEGRKRARVGKRRQSLRASPHGLEQQTRDIGEEKDGSLVQRC